MAEVDRASVRRRVPVEVWWWLERRAYDVYSQRARHREARGLDPDTDVPWLLERVQGVTYAQRKAAERRALMTLGLWP